MNKTQGKRNRRAWLALLSVVVLLLPGCVTVNVTNISKDQNARVYIQFLDRKGYTSTSLAPGQSDTDFSDGTGYYLIRVGGNEDYQRQMKELQDTYRKVLTTPGLTSEQVQAITKKIALLKDQEEKAKESYARCEGSVDNGSVTVTVDWDASKRDWTLECTEEESKPSK
ncbi:MAG: hypothetical protein QOH93_1299 [Chloroflexia bacterium]|jgi:hypothetical protein|nr:hypothetical protein [Chloroflexia bacterium]